MKINLIIFISSVKEQTKKYTGEVMIKTVESTIRPAIGDILEDPGFHPGYHNGYEVVKVTINYAADECFVSLSPLMLEKEDIEISTYIDRLKTHGWDIVSKEELTTT